MSKMLDKIRWYVNRTIDSVFQSFFDSCKLFEKKTDHGETEAYSGPNQRSKMELFVQKWMGFRP